MGFYCSFGIYLSKTVEIQSMGLSLAMFSRLLTYHDMQYYKTNMSCQRELLRFKASFDRSHEVHFKNGQERRIESQKH